MNLEDDRKARFLDSLVAMSTGAFVGIIDH
jgi:hypothetical protein